MTREVLCKNYPVAKKNITSHAYKIGSSGHLLRVPFQISDKHSHLFLYRSSLHGQNLYTTKGIEVCFDNVQSNSYSWYEKMCMTLRYRKSHFELFTDKGGKNTNITIALLPYLKINTEKRTTCWSTFKLEMNYGVLFQMSYHHKSQNYPLRSTSRFINQVKTWELFTLVKFLWLFMLVFPPYFHIL